MKFANWFLKLFFQHLYTTLAWTYDLVAGVASVGQWNSWIEVSLETIPPGKVLELGHGPGHLQLLLNERGNTAYGLDASSQMVRRASKRLRRASLPSNICQGLAAELPFPSECFDAVVATFPTEYIIDERVVREIRRTLRSGGRLTIVPVAYIRGPLWIDRLAAGLFRITGQAPPPSDDWDQSLQTVGFRTKIERVDLPRAQVVRILADKTDK